MNSRDSGGVGSAMLAAALVVIALVILALYMAPYGPTTLAPRPAASGSR